MLGAFRVRTARMIVRHVGDALVGLVREDRTTSLIALGFGLTQLLTIAWDLPGSHGWENDGVAPRDLFAGIANNLTPGRGHQYPLLHCLLLGLLSLPLLLLAALGGPLTAAALRERVLSVPTMTGISLIAKATAIAMACVSLFVLSRIVRRTVGTRAARFTALFVATNLTFAFYGRVSNLEIPYLTWTLLALNAALDVIEHGGLAPYRRFALFSAAAIATKDQAYACLVLVGAIYLVLLPLAGDAEQRKERLVFFGKGLAWGALGYGLMSGALLNPTGFWARIKLLSGPASQGWRGYERGASGLFANVRDALSAEPLYYWPHAALGVAWLGVIVAALAPPGPEPLARRAPRLLPFVAGLSSFLFFTLPVARDEPRFILPLGLMLAAYGGIGSDFLLTQVDRVMVARPLGAVLRLGLAVALAFSGWKSFAVHLTQLGDARHAVSDWLARVPRGTKVETYGLTVYAPHFEVGPSAPYRVRRVGPTRPKARNPLIGVEEVQGEIAAVDERKPDVLVLSEGFANAYVVARRTGGRALSSVIEERQSDRRTQRFVEQAVTDTLPGYRRVFVARPEFPSWARAFGLAPQAIHSTTGLWLSILVREGSSLDPDRP